MQPTPYEQTALFYDKIFFTNILRVLHERGMSINELHEWSGVAAATISDITRGQGNPTIKTMSDISAALGIPLPELLTPNDPTLAKELEKISALYCIPSLPPGFEYISAILESFQAFQVKQWDAATRKKLKKIKQG